MKLGITGLPQCGKSTVFHALTGARGTGGTASSGAADQKISTITVADERVDFLSAIYGPKKTTHAQIEYLLPSALQSPSSEKTESGIWNQLRGCDALLHVLRNFQLPGGPLPDPEHDFHSLEQDMILGDLLVVEKRLEKIELERKRGRKPSEDEFKLINACRDILEKGEVLRAYPDIAGNPLLKGFTFLSAKPALVITNNRDEDEAVPQWDKKPKAAEIMPVRARLEMDIAAMPAGEAEEFLEAYNIRESALDRVIRRSFVLLNRISFFTVGQDEVKAWSIPAGLTAPEAAGAVHSDMQKGFIRAEVLSFEDLKIFGSFQDAKKAGRTRLEGKEYTVVDGDIINFRFNV